jgi:hypothetical protein
MAAMAIGAALIGQMGTTFAGTVFLARFGLAVTRWMTALHRFDAPYRVDPLPIRNHPRRTAAIS